MSGESAIFAPRLLRGQAALVTGGGTGLGKATALELARCGASVTIAGRRDDVLAEAAGEIAAVATGDVHTLVGDIRERDDARRLIGESLQRAGRLDLLVNNAGGQFFSPAELIATKGWRAVWRLNVEGMLNMAEAAYELAFAAEGARSEARAGGAAAGDGDDLSAGGNAGGGGAPSAGAELSAGEDASAGGEVSGGADRRAAGNGRAAGSIVNVTLSPHHGMPGMAHSGAARATVEALTRELARRWGPAGVTVTAIAVGTFDTEVMVKYPAAVRAGMSRSVPLQRTGTVAEHAWLVGLLASPLGAAFNGATVTLDGARDNWFGPWPPPGLADEEGEVPVEERR
jgi:NAD(P)-dependent dehydrogenase (short-subunit alcohol dehydrogenase family)